MSGSDRKTAVIVSASARRAVASFESKCERRIAAKSTETLSPLERADLLLMWSGNESAAGGSRSAFGAIMTAALRAPPREGPVRLLVRDELERQTRNGKSLMPVDSLVKIIAGEGKATAHEVRAAVRRMRQDGILSQEVCDWQHTSMVFDPETGKHVPRTVTSPTECVQLVGDAPGRRVTPFTNEERWRRQDEDLRQFCEGFIPCHETRSKKPSESDVDRQPFPAMKMPALMGLTRVILERVYGTNYHSAYREVFGPEHAPIVEYTEAFAVAHREVAANQRAEPTVDEVLRAVLDAAPKDLHAAIRWRQDRVRFIQRAKSQAQDLLVKACEEYRLARKR